MSVLINVLAGLIGFFSLFLPELFSILGKLSHSTLVECVPLFVLGKIVICNHAIDEFIVFKLIRTDHDLLLIVTMRLQIDGRGLLLSFLRLCFIELFP